MNSDEGVEFVSAWRMLEARGVQIHKSRKEEFAKNAIVERFLGNPVRDFKIVP
jgi:hypothetical protein